MPGRCSRSQFRFISGAAAALMASTYLAVPAAASGTPSLQVALCVVEFGDVSRMADTELGALAAARFTHSLAQTKSSDVIAESVRLQCQRQLGLSGAPARPARARLADASGANQVVYGTITSAKISTGPNARASVRLTVLVEEAQTGRLVFGAVSEGLSAPATERNVDRRALLAQAFGNAAESFARYLANPEAVRSAVGPRVVSEALHVQEDAVPGTAVGAQAAPLLNAKERQQRLTDIEMPAPVVVDIPGGSLEGSRPSERRALLSNKTWKLLVGGALFMGLIYLAGAGGIGATRPF